MKKLAAAALLATLSATTSACMHHQVRVDPVEVEPIHMTVDINVRMEEDAAEALEDEGDLLPPPPPPPRRGR